MSNPVAAKVAAAAAEYARANPTPDNRATANALCVDAVRAGATGTDIQQAVQNNR
ncbi:hypothetical protein OG342_04980 [Streptomyces bobili]|uniref:hypothetical protein n=1 Tax=Streptomyces bobili TaxID=67280 RepID=UPI002255D76C|nr:hypothetical protein [Streptomyces bobili]MCX5522222.1 hypothetical protein [Streptomyces bobili]